MSTAILFYMTTHDRYGVKPVNSFNYPENVPADYLDWVNTYLNQILEPFTVSGFGSQEFWVDDKDRFDPEEVAGYGYVYSEQKADDNILLTADAYEAAKIIATFFVSSEWWDLLLSDDIERSEYSITDIPLTNPTSSDDELLVDPRFVQGDVVVNSQGEHFVYAGVYIDAHNKYAAEKFYLTPEKEILIGLENKFFVKLEVIDRFIRENRIEVHPLPQSYTHSKYFSRSREHKKIEGFGRTQKLAKMNLAYKILVQNLD